MRYFGTVKVLNSSGISFLVIIYPMGVFVKLTDEDNLLTIFINGRMINNNYFADGKILHCEEKNMELIPAKKHHAEQVYALVQETIKIVYPKYYLKEIVDMFCEFHSLKNIITDIEAGNTYILAENEEIIGTGTKNENHITRVYVLPQYQKKGYGTFIMNRLEEIIKETYDDVIIDASLPACRSYSHLGYQTADHGTFECKNSVILVYEIMKKQLRNESLNPLIIRPYKPKDAEVIISWIKDELSFRKWSADRYGAYPISAEDMNDKYFKCNGDCEEPDNFYPITAVDANGPVGHLIMRYTNKAKTIIRLGFIIVDDTKRGMGYGKRMIQMAMRYAFDMLKAEKITLGVFENNPPAYHCYKAAGFHEIPLKEDIVFEILEEKWKCIEMEATFIISQ